MSRSKNVAIVFALLTFVLIPWGGLQAAEVTPYLGDLNPVSEVGYSITIEGDGHKLELSISELEKLPLYKSVIKTRWGLEGEFVGVNLIELLKYAGITEFERLFVRASNDYKITIGSMDAGIDNVILASRLNGKPFSLDNKGPFFIIWPDQSEEVLSGKTLGTKWAWSTVYIHKIH